MLTITKRSFTDEETKEIKARLPSTSKKIEEAILLFMGVYMVPLLCFLGLDTIFHFSSTTQLIFVIVNALLTLFIIYRIRLKFGLKPTKTPKEMEVFHVKTTRAIRREEYEDLGDSFYIDITVDGRQKTLYLWGQHFYELIEDKKFPNTDFQVLRKSGEHSTFDIKILGSYFEPEKILPPFDKKTWKEGNIPYDLDILEFTIDQIN